MHSSEQYRSFFQGDYHIQTNQWGKDESGYQHMTVLKENAFIVQWVWLEKPEQVHAYPNIGLVFEPVLLKDAALRISSKHCALGSCRANVAVDIFLDADATRSKDPCIASYEMMVWLDMMGDIYPIGHKSGPLGQHNIDGRLFSLFRGFNHVGQEVFTWIAESRQQQKIDLRVFLLFLQEHLPQVYIGIVQVGIEEFTSVFLLF